MSKMTQSQPSSASNADADVIVLGVGTAGEDLSLMLLDAGLDVIGIEANLVGGETGSRSKTSARAQGVRQRQCSRSNPAIQFAHNHLRSDKNGRSPPQKRRLSVRPHRDLNRLCVFHIVSFRRVQQAHQQDPEIAPDKET